MEHTEFQYFVPLCSAVCAPRAHHAHAVYSMIALERPYTLYSRSHCTVDRASTTIHLVRYILYNRTVILQTLGCKIAVRFPCQNRGPYIQIAYKIVNVHNIVCTDHDFARTAILQTTHVLVALRYTRARGTVSRISRMRVHMRVHAYRPLERFRSRYMQMYPSARARARGRARANPRIARAISRIIFLLIASRRGFCNCNSAIVY